MARHTPRERWTTLTTAAYFDGRCEAVVNERSDRPERRCRQAAVSVDDHGFAVCRRHHQKLVLLDEFESPPRRSTCLVTGFDPKAGAFRFGHLVPVTRIELPTPDF